MKTIRCPKCKGKGESYSESTYPPRSREHRLVTCQHCGGTGRLPAQGNEQNQTTKKQKARP